MTTYVNGHTPVIAVQAPLLGFPLPAPAPLADRGGALLDELDTAISDLAEARS